jgi:2-methylcitrate dehydratase PrpD
MDHAQRIASLAWDELPALVRAQACRCLKDVLAASAGSLALPAARQIEALVCAQFGRGPVPLFFTGTFTTFAGAAFGNALRIDSLDCHDGFRPNKGHAGATVVPAALAAAAVAAAASAPVSGAELLTAVVIGYETACRAGLAVHGTYSPAYHGSGAWAAVGAAAAAARILRVPAGGVDAVMGAAEYYGPMSPILRCTANPSIVKDGAGAGAWAAAMALAMHAQGMSGLPSLFVDEPLGREQIATFGADWLILRQYFKLYPTCRWTHPPVEALVRIRAEHGFDAADVEQIEVESFAETATLMRFPPSDSDGAQYCLPWALAAVLTDGALGVEQILPARLADPGIIALGRRVAVRAAPDIQARFPQECLARVTLRLRDGRSLTSPTMGAKGDHTNPAEDSELDDKFRRLVSGTLGQQACGRLEDVLDSLDRRSSADLLALLGRGDEP